MDAEILAGPHAVAAALDSHPERIETLWVARDRRDARITALLERARAAGVRWRAVPRERLDALSGGLRHQGVVARCQPLPLRDERRLQDDLAAAAGTPLWLVLDGVQDPRNLGACLRSAAAAGAHGVVVPRDRSSPLTGAALRAAAGGAEAVPLYQVKNLVRALQGLKARGLWLAGLAAEGEDSLYQADLTGPLALVVGAEGRGLRRLTRETCDFLLRIPQAPAVPHLNLSVAAAIALFEARRQRG